MSRKKPCCVGEGIKKGAWTTEEDKKLISYIHEHGEGSWRDMPLKAGLKRCGKSCRLRWANYLKPDIKRGEFSHEEEQIIIMLHASRGNKWSVIARHLPKRTDNEVKNYWNTHLKKRLIDQGIDPVTHKPLVSNPNPTPSMLIKEDDSSNNQGKSDEQYSQLGSLSSPISLPLEISSGDDHDKGFLTSKKRCFRRSSSTSKLLNKVATRASSIGNILSASMEGTLFNSTTPLLYCLQHACLNNDHDLSETSQIYMEESGPIFSENMINHDIKEDLGMDFDINNSEYDFSQFLENLSHNNGEEAENIQDHIISEEVSSTSADEDDMMQNINDWSTYLVDHSDFVYDMDVQDYNEDKIRR